MTNGGMAAMTAKKAKAKRRRRSPNPDPDYWDRQDEVIVSRAKREASDSTKSELKCRAKRHTVADLE